MSYRCLDTWTFEGQTINLSKITDFSVITPSIENLTVPTRTVLFEQNSLPSYVSQGDVVYTYNADDNNTYDFFKNDKIGIVLGKYSYGSTWYGAIFYNYLANNVISYWGNNPGSVKPRYYYFSIIVNEATQRAFVLCYTYYSALPNPYYGAIISYMYNGTDILYDSIIGMIKNGGGAGSGYIGNALVSNKKMVGYNVPTSSAEGTKTESVEVYDSNYVANKPKAGNGHCRIKLLNEVTINDAFDLFTTTNVNNKVVNSYSKDRIYLNPSEDTYTDFVSYLGNPDYMLVGGQDSNGKKTPTIDTVNKTIAYTNTSMGSSASWTLIPITQLSNVIKIKATIKFDSKYNQYSSLIIKLYYIDENILVTGNSYEIYIPWQSSSNYNVGDWYDLEVNCSMAKCDYICFGTGWDTVTFKNVKLYSM